MDDIIVSAPGKVILHGEHAVVYGKRALAASLDLRTFIRVRTLHDGCDVTVNLPDIDVIASWSTPKLESSLTLPLCACLTPAAPSEWVLGELRRLAGQTEDSSDTRSLAVVAFLYLYCSITPDTDRKLPSIDLTLTSCLPPSAGLGSSAAYSVCVAASLLELAGRIPRPQWADGDTLYSGAYCAEHLDLINLWAFQSEKVIHGNPSGIDNAISVHGGALCFQAGKITTITKVPKLQILLTNTKVPRSTKVLVAGVKNKYKKYPRIIEPVIESIEAITVRCEEVLTEMEGGPTRHHFDILKELVAMNQCHLELLGVSHPALKAVSHVTGERGLATKLTGAGGGGCAFTLLPPGTDGRTLAAVRETLVERGFSSWETQLGGPGVQRVLDPTQLASAPSSFSRSSQQPHPEGGALCQTEASL